MRRPIDVRVFGGIAVAEETIQRLLILNGQAGWRRLNYGFPPIERPTSITFSAPQGRFARPGEASVVLDPARGELELFVEVDGLSRGTRPGRTPATRSRWASSLTSWGPRRRPLGRPYA